MHSVYYTVEMLPFYTDCRPSSGSLFHPLDDNNSYLTSLATSTEISLSLFRFSNVSPPHISDNIPVFTYCTRFLVLGVFWLFVFLLFQEHTNMKQVFLYYFLLF